MNAPEPPVGSLLRRIYSGDGIASGDPSPYPLGARSRVVAQADSVDPVASDQTAPTALNNGGRANVAVVAGDEDPVDAE